MKLVLALFILLFQLAANADVTIVTYNMAQLRKKGLDLVACTKRRVPLQVQAMFGDAASPVFADKHFIFTIQESWTKESFSALRAVAMDRNYFFFPDDYDVVKNSGQLIISDLHPLEEKRIPFSKDKYAQKGMLYARLDLGDNKTFGIINVHTGYSDKTGFSDEHRRHFEELGRTIEEMKPQSTYFAVSGDFNAGPDMDFKKPQYNSSQIVWEQGLMPLIKNNGLRLLESVGITWDDTNNALVKIPPLLLRLVNEYKNGYIGWDQTDSTLDHIFVLENQIVTRHELAFKEKVKLNCGKRDDKDGMLNLSDHYGVMAVLKTE
ncbi:MAG: hypothetical protein ACJ76H_15465 [Bacteriovoracaceae bacterium]